MKSEGLDWVGNYYSEKLRAHGPTPAGVDWNSEASQLLRFQQLLRLVDHHHASDDFTLLDVGCGYGALLPALRARFPHARYTGYDVASSMIEEARRQHTGDERAVFTSVTEELASTYDYVVASGIFNVRDAKFRDVWHDHVMTWLNWMHGHSGQGWAANFLTSYSDPPRMRENLHYADPLALFDFCKREMAPAVALLHDYGLYEFTLIVRKASSFPR